MNWKFWTWGKREKAQAELFELLVEQQAQLAEGKRTQQEVGAMLEKLQRPVGEMEQVKFKLNEGLGALSETHPSWIAVMLFIEYQRRCAHLDAAGSFATDREAWIAFGREQGIERVQMGLVKALLEAKKKKG